MEKRLLTLPYNGPSVAVATLGIRFEPPYDRAWMVAHSEIGQLLRSQTGLLPELAHCLSTIPHAQSETVPESRRLRSNPLGRMTAKPDK
jgi:hypothetical protein